jgi:DNA-binding NarL/FixJ family response regulator
MSTISYFVVEDHSLTNLGIRQFFSAKEELVCRGFAYDKDEAEKKLQKLDEENKLPSILVLDLMLGNASGLEILKLVKEKYENIKVVVSS